MADATDLKSVDRKVVGVQVPPCPLFKSCHLIYPTSNNEHVRRYQTYTCEMFWLGFYGFTFRT